MLVLVAGAYTGWLLWQVQSDLKSAQLSIDQARTAVSADDTQGRDRALADFRVAAASAESTTDGWWWAALSRLPFIGDDATGVRALSSSLDTIAGGAVGPLAASVGQLDSLTVDGQIDVGVVRGLARPVDRAARAFASADASVSRLESAGYAAPLKSRFDEYVDLVGRTSRALASTEKAVRVLPTMVGADGPRDYLLIFQNNAEIRATGGLPGSWALIHAERGRLRLTKQGSAADFPVLDRPVLPLTGSERAVYDEPLGIYWHDAGFTPDFPRAAELWSAHWDETFPRLPLDGVVALDPVGLSYVVEGTGPVTVGPTTLTSQNLVDELLSKPYLELQPQAQDALFQRVARAIFEAATGDLASPVTFVQGLSRAAGEGRLLVAPFHPDVAKALHGTRVLGALAGDDGATPHVDVGLNDATGSKMSYYLRYGAEVKAESCRSGVQQLSGSMTLHQTITAGEAAALPPYLTGGGNFGVDRGSQLVAVRLYGPFGGTLGKVSVEGRRLGQLKVVQLDGRPVATVVAQVSDPRDIEISWTMTTGAGQTGPGELGLTPSVVPGSEDKVFSSAC
jgi:hypothetical protein